MALIPGNDHSNIAGNQEVARRGGGGQKLEALPKGAQVLASRVLLQFIDTHRLGLKLEYSITDIEVHIDSPFKLFLQQSTSTMPLDLKSRLARLVLNHKKSSNASDNVFFTKNLSLLGNTQGYRNLYEIGTVDLGTDKFILILCMTTEDFTDAVDKLPDFEKDSKGCKRQAICCSTPSQKTSQSEKSSIIGNKTKVAFNEDSNPCLSSIEKTIKTIEPSNVFHSNFNQDKPPFAGKYSYSDFSVFMNLLNKHIETQKSLGMAIKEIFVSKDLTIVGPEGRDFYYHIGGVGNKRYKYPVTLCMNIEECLEVSSWNPKPDRELELNTQAQDCRGLCHPLLDFLEIKMENLTSIYHILKSEALSRFKSSCSDSIIYIDRDLNLTKSPQLINNKAIQLFIGDFVVLNKLYQLVACIPKMKEKKAPAENIMKLSVTVDILRGSFGTKDKVEGRIQHYYLLWLIAYRYKEPQEFLDKITDIMGNKCQEVIKQNLLERNLWISQNLALIGFMHAPKEGMLPIAKVEIGDQTFSIFKHLTPEELEIASKSEFYKAKGLKISSDGKIPNIPKIPKKSNSFSKSLAKRLQSQNRAGLNKSGDPKKAVNSNGQKKKSGSEVKFSLEFILTAEKGDISCLVQLYEFIVEKCFPSDFTNLLKENFAKRLIKKSFKLIHSKDPKRTLVIISDINNLKEIQVPSPTMKQVGDINIDGEEIRLFFTETTDESLNNAENVSLPKLSDGLFIEKSMNPFFESFDKEKVEALVLEINTFIDEKRKRGESLTQVFLSNNLNILEGDGRQNILKSVGKINHQGQQYKLILTLNKDQFEKMYFKISENKVLRELNERSKRPTEASDCRVIYHPNILQLGVQDEKSKIEAIQEKALTLYNENRPSDVIYVNKDLQLIEKKRLKKTLVAEVVVSNRIYKVVACKKLPFRNNNEIQPNQSIKRETVNTDLTSCRSNPSIVHIYYSFNLLAERYKLLNWQKISSQIVRQYKRIQKEGQHVRALWISNDFKRAGLLLHPSEGMVEIGKITIESKEVPIYGLLSKDQLEFLKQSRIPLQTWSKSSSAHSIECPGNGSSKSNPSKEPEGKSSHPKPIKSDVGHLKTLDKTKPVEPQKSKEEELIALFKEQATSSPPKKQKLTRKQKAEKKEKERLKKEEAQKAKLEAERELNRTKETSRKFVAAKLQKLFRAKKERNEIQAIENQNNAAKNLQAVIRRMLVKAKLKRENLATTKIQSLARRYLVIQYNKKEQKEKFQNLQANLFNQLVELSKKAEAERAEIERIAAEKAEVERAAAEKAEIERIALEKAEANVALTPRIKAIDARIDSLNEELKQLGEVSYSNFEEMLNLYGLVAVFEGLKLDQNTDLPPYDRKYQNIPREIKLKAKLNPETDKRYYCLLFQRNKIRQERVNFLKDITIKELDAIGDDPSELARNRSKALQKYQIGLELIKGSNAPLKPIDSFDLLPRAIQERVKEIAPDLFSCL
ncbi:MAG: hypothetical protein S4CHLAM20_12240 [Chlamydiia bacterium]|nr:hypothetical protein [Chlamydiia bacterium]